MIAASTASRIAALSACVMALLALGWVHHPVPVAAGGVDIHVTKTADTADGTCDNDCSLREAIILSNDDFAQDRILVPAGVYTLSLEPGDPDTPETGDLDIDRSVTIEGDGREDTIIDADSIDRVFQVGLATAEISKMTLRNGDTPDSGGAISGGTVMLTEVDVLDNTAAKGGGGVSSGGVTLVDSRVLGNEAGQNGGGVDIGSFGHGDFTRSTIADNAAEGSGGGVYNLSGTVTVTKSTISGNAAAEAGGAISNYTNGDLTIETSTLSGNTAGEKGGAINNGAAVMMSNTTVYGNIAPVGMSLRNDGDLNVHNSIVALESGSLAASGATTNCELLSPLQSDGYNIDSGVDCGLNATGDQDNTDPLVSPLQFNGGPTLTHALRDGSPAIDEGGGCASTDQREASRPLGDGCDIGSFERRVIGDGLYVWGDNNCSGEVEADDALADLRSEASLEPLPVGECPEVGSQLGGGFATWGDVDCSGSAGTADAMQIFRYLAVLPRSPQTEPCPDLGTQVSTSG